MDEKQLDKILETLHPAIRAQLEELFDAPHLQGLSKAEIFWVSIAHGLLTSVLNGTFRGDLRRIRRIVNFDELETAYKVLERSSKSLYN